MAILLHGKIFGHPPHSSVLKCLKWGHTMVGNMFSIRIKDSPLRSELLRARQTVHQMEFFAVRPSAVGWRLMVCFGKTRTMRYPDYFNHTKALHREYGYPVAPEAWEENHLAWGSRYYNWDVARIVFMIEWLAGLLQYSRRRISFCSALTLHGILSTPTHRSLLMVKHSRIRLLQKAKG